MVGLTPVEIRGHIETHASDDGEYNETRVHDAPALIGSSTLENSNDIGEIESAEVITLVCSFLDGVFEPRAAEQGEFIRRLITSGGCPIDWRTSSLLPILWRP